MTKTKGKRGRPTLEELLERPWCYYCSKDFDDLKILVDHQKAKHYKCQVAHCNRRLNTVGGLRVHMQQVHKEELKSVPNAFEDRDDVNLEIFGMEGIPPQMRQAYNQQVTQAYYKQEAEHRARTGNNLHGSSEQPAAKKPKLDDEARAELKKRAAEAKAKREAQKAAAAAGLPYPSETASPVSQSHTPTPSGALPAPPGVDQLSINSPVPVMPTLPPAPLPHYPTTVPPVYGGYAQPPVPVYPPQYHPLPQAVSPPGWARPAGLPQPPHAIGVPPQHPPFSPPGSNGLPPFPPSAFSPPPAAHGVPPHLPARLPPTTTNGSPAYANPGFDLNKLMDEQSKIALDRLNGKSPATEDANKPSGTTEATRDRPAEKPAKAAKKKQPTRLVLSDNEVSWEERRATLTKYQKPLVTDSDRVTTALGAADDKVTGVVDAAVAETTVQS